MSLVSCSNKVFVVFCTAPSLRDASKISSVLVSEKLAACVNLIPAVKSFFHWRGRLSKTSECLLLIKTVSSNLERLERRIKKLHPYDVPEIISFPIAKANRKYMNWVMASCACD